MKQKQPQIRHKLKLPKAKPEIRAERTELKYHGSAACLALWKHRPSDVIRVYVERARLTEFSELLKWCAAQRKAYHVVENEDLERLTASVHHGGICMLALEQRGLAFEKLCTVLRKQRGPQLLVYLDGVENPHNLGAIVRTCAHFGVRYVLGEKGHLPRMAASACRVAEGGAEQVALVHLTHPLDELRELQKDGFQLLGTSGRKGTSTYEFEFPQHAIIVLGAEAAGMSRELDKIADKILIIPGSGMVESLNVSVACAVFTSEFYRQTNLRAANHGAP